MKDVYFNDLNNSNNDDIPILTPEEIRLIKQRRQQRLNDLNSVNDDDSFITPPQERRSYDVDYQFDPNEYRRFQRQDTQDIPITNQHRYRQQDNYEDYEEEYHEQLRPQKPAEQKPKKKNRHGCGCLGGGIFAIFLALVIGFVGCFGYVLNMMNKMNIQDSIENAFVSKANLTSSEDVKNILLIGLDSDENGTARSDTMMLLTLDKLNKKLKLTSFLRDMWVEIPDYKDAKLNASYSHGGAQLTMDTIEYNFDIDIDNYVLVDFDLFRKIIDALGGIQVEITEREAKFINRTTSSVVQSGINQLDGKKALIYARIRKLDSDFYRTQRQRKVITALVDKLKTINPLELLEIAQEILPLISTDINALGMVSTGLTALGCMGLDIEQLQVPADDAYKSKTIRGQSALVPDLDKNIKNIKDFIYG